MTTKKLTPQTKGNRSSLTTRKGEYPFVSFLEEMDRMIGDFFRDFDRVALPEKPGIFNPKVDVLDTDKEVTVMVELPGLSENDIELSLTRDVLTIKGEKKTEKEDKGKGHYHMERSYGAFSRTIPLPAEVNGNKVDAKFKKGILTVTLPKTEKTIQQTKRVQVKTE
jgi:HSP20 family protein